MLSYPENIPDILRVVARLNPPSVLDVGAGLGKYGLLIREQYLSDKAAGGQLVPQDDLFLEACEMTPFFLQRPELSAIYDVVHGRDFREFPASALRPDELVLMIDVVEHYEKEEVLKWLRTISERVLVSTPKETVMYQEHFYGDPHHHCSQWSPADVAEFSEVEDLSNERSWIFLIRPRVPAPRPT